MAIYSEKQLLDDLHSMSNDMRIALSRVLSDIIKSDKIIEDSEVAKYAKLFDVDEDSIENTNIHSQFFRAHELTFADAVKTLSSSLVSERIVSETTRSRKREHLTNVVMESSRYVTSGSGYYSPSEAVLVLALKYYLSEKESVDRRYDIQSYPLSDLFIGKRFVFYIAEKDDFGINASLSSPSVFHVVSHLLSSIGFQFVYIPHIRELYKSRGSKWFRMMSLLLFPDISTSKVDSTYERMCEMRTDVFVRDYLKKKMGFARLGTAPSLMVMLGRDQVICKDRSEKGLRMKSYANLLLIHLKKGEEIIGTVGEFVRSYSQLVSSTSYTNMNPRFDKFMFHGVYQMIFSLMALVDSHPDFYQLNFMTGKHCKMFVNDIYIDLRPGKVALYMLIVYESLFSAERGIRDLSDQSYADAIDERYKKIYSLLTQGQSVKAHVANRFNQTVDDIKKEMSSKLDSTRVLPYVKISESQLVSTAIPLDKIYIDRMPLSECEEWQGL